MGCALVIQPRTLLALAAGASCWLILPFLDLYLYPKGNDTWLLELYRANQAPGGQSWLTAYIWQNYLGLTQQPSAQLFSRETCMTLEFVKAVKFGPLYIWWIVNVLCSLCAHFFPDVIPARPWWQWPAILSMGLMHYWLIQFRLHLKWLCFNYIWYLEIIA